MRKSRILSALLVLVLVLSSCGGSDNSKETAVPQGSQTEESQTTETVEEKPTSETVEETTGTATVEETSSTETYYEKLCKERNYFDWEIIIPYFDEDGDYQGCASSEAHAEGMIACYEQTTGEVILSAVLDEDGNWTGECECPGDCSDDFHELSDYNFLLEESIQVALDDWIAANGAPGSSLAVLLPDGSEVLVAAGVRDLRKEGVATTEDYWRIASITKSLTSAVVLLLVEEGLIDVEATVATYLGDEWATGYELGGVDYAPLITVRQILNHTDGFREYAFDPGFYLLASARLDVAMEPQEIVDWAFNVGPQYVPGTEYSYNTVGHVVAGLVIEAVTGRPAHEVMRDYLFTPAEASDMYLPPKEFPPELVPAMYIQGELADLIALLPGLAPYLDDARVGDFLDLSVGPQEVLTSAPWTGGGVEAQMDDLARLYKAMFDGTILREETVALFSETALDTSYGLGIQLSERVGYRTYEHGGGVPGFRSHARYYPDLGISIVLSANLIPLDPDVGQLADSVTQLVLEHLESMGWLIPSPIGEDQNEGTPEDPNAGNAGS